MPQSKVNSPRSAARPRAGSRRGPGKQPLGREVPRLWTKPRRKLTPKTTAGYEAIDFAENVLGLTLFPWQRWLLLHMLELNPDGTFRFRTVVILVGRQNGKTTIMQVVSLWRMYVDGVALVIGTAQNLDVAEEAWEATVELAGGVPELAAEIGHVDRTNGKKALRLKTGERYKVAASNRRGGRGLSGDLALLDELREHQNWQAWSAVSKTTIAKKVAQIVAMSNAGDRRSVVLAHLRKKALQAIEANDASTSMGLFEWSAPEDAEIDDRDGWAQACPALGYTITEASIENALETDDEDVFRTEVLCQWVDEDVIDPTIPPDDWDDRYEGSSRIVGDVHLGVDTNPKRTRSTISAAGASNLEGRIHTKVLELGAGASWLEETLLERAAEHDATVHLDPVACGSLIPALTAAGIDVKTISGREVAQACQALHDGVTGGKLAHEGQDALDEAAVSVGTRKLGEGFAWTHRGAGDVDITPIVSATWAYWGAVCSAEADYDVLDSIL